MNTIKRVETGLYYLYDGDELVYIGSSDSVFARVGCHSDKTWDHFAVIECGKDERYILEAREILEYQPKYNMGVPSNQRYMSKKLLKDALGIDGHAVNHILRSVSTWTFRGLIYADIEDCKQKSGGAL